MLNACTFLLVMARHVPGFEASTTVAAIRAEFPEAVAAAAAAFPELSIPSCTFPAAADATSKIPAAAPMAEE